MKIILLLAILAGALILADRHQGTRRLAARIGVLAARCRYPHDPGRRNRREAEWGSLGDDGHALQLLANSLWLLVAYALPRFAANGVALRRHARAEPGPAAGNEPRPVDLEAMAQIRALAQNIHSGSLGISGPRGAGKSTILHSFGADPDGLEDAAEDGRLLRLVVAAPVDYEPREFIIHLFSRLCEVVMCSPDATRAITAETRRHLKQLRHLRTYTSSRKATLAPWSAFGQRLPAGPLATVPELVQTFRGYSRDVASWRRAAHGDKARVVIAIDEVDKIRDSDRAAAFINDIRAVFGVPGCLYLVSLNEDAMADFTCRTPSIRSSFDSAFDELVFVGPMTYPYSEQLLSQRLIGLPRPSIALCHVLAGGLPRDVIRAARTLMDATSGGGEKSLPDTAQDLIRRELESLRYSYLRQLAQNAASCPALAALDNPQWPGKAPFTSAVSQLAAAARDAEPGETRRLCHELAVSLSFYATVLDVFAPGGLDRLDTCLRDQGAGHALVNDLAVVRHAMRVDTTHAQQLLVQYRERNDIGQKP